MANLKLALYHLLPASLRNLAATARGYQLRRLRYGPETERIAREAVDRECWSAEQWQGWRTERLRRWLHRAATEVPYYRRQWEERRRQGDRSSWEELANWPILEKDVVREMGASLVRGGEARVAEGRLVREHTSGTTGKPITVWSGKDGIRLWYALSEARWRWWYGVSRHDRWAIFGGQLVVPVSQRRPPFWVWNQGLNQLYCSSYHLAPGLIPSYLDALVEHRVAFLLGYTSALYAVAQEILRRGRQDLRLKVVIANAEPVLDYQRAAIEAAFQCPLRETYGMSEMVAAASQCEAGRLHLWPEAGVVEVAEKSRFLSPGECGDLICTGLTNEELPLIRYRVGDRGVLTDPASRCACGRTLPGLDRIEGRSDDVLYTAEGRAVGRLDPVFKSDLPVREAQIVQESLGRIVVNYVPDPEFRLEVHGRSLQARLQERLGRCEIVLQEVGEVPRTANGKFRAVICRLSPADRERLAAGS